MNDPRSRHLPARVERPDVRPAVVRSVALLLSRLERTLVDGGVSEPVAEAREIVAALHDAPRFWPVANAHLAVTDAFWNRALSAARRRAAGAPAAYAVGRAAFRHLTLEVDERVLIPRPETELLVDLVAEEQHGRRTGGVAIDVGTGSGALALALATEGVVRFDRVYGTDVSLDALRVAHANLRRVQRQLTSPVQLVHGSLLAGLGETRPQVIVANPPYIAFEEAPRLPRSVRDWEPAVALFSPEQGLSVTRQLVTEAVRALAPGGLLALEVDARRAALVAELVSAEQRFATVQVRLDLSGRERFVLARRQECE